MERLELSHFTGGSAERHSHFGKCLAFSQKIKKSYYVTQRFCFLVYIQEKRKHVHIKTCTLFVHEGWGWESGE